MQKNDLARIQGWIALGRQPHTAGATALVADVVDRITPLMGGKRPLGPKARPGLLDDTGTVLAGMMRPGIGAARAPRGKASRMWSGKGGGLIGFDRFWRIADALVAGGLAGFVPGTRGEDHDGKAAVLWPTEALWAVAACHGVTPDTRKADWLLSDTAAAPSKSLGIRCAPWEDLPPTMLPGMEVERDRLATELNALNALNASVVIRGAGPSVTLFRSFLHSLRFHGRWYGPAYMNVSEQERARISFDGEVSVEVDVRAAQLSLLCALAGHVGPDGELPQPDLYALDGIPRPAAKAWTVRTLGRGTIKWRRRAWDFGDAPEIKAVGVADVEAAMVARYPFLKSIVDVVPPGVLADIPAPRRCKAAGQWLVRREADVIGAAMGYCVTRGVPVLPVHDALIVPASQSHIARQALHGAYFALAGVKVNLKG